MKTSGADNLTASPDALREQAQGWLRTLVSGDVNPQDAEAFKRWLSANPVHKTAFYEVKRDWEALKPGIGEMLRTNRQAAAFHDRTMHGSPAFGRRALLGGALSAAAVAGVAVLHPPARLWPSVGEWGADYRTATGEQRAVVLADSVNVTLNTQTSIRRVRAGGETTGIDLLMGEAAIDLPQSSMGRSFSVSAGAGQSHAEAGRFEVRYLAGKVCVSCIEGTVRVEHPAGSQVLQARQQTIYDASALSGVASIDPADVSAWRKGELVFRQTRLADVIDEINRYRVGRVLLLNSAVRDRPVSGRFAIAWLDAALLQLQHTFDLNVRSLPGGLSILS